MNDGSLVAKKPIKMGLLLKMFHVKHFVFASIKKYCLPAGRQEPIFGESDRKLSQACPAE